MSDTTRYSSCCSYWSLQGFYGSVESKAGRPVDPFDRSVVGSPTPCVLTPKTRASQRAWPPEASLGRPPKADFLARLPLGGSVGERSFVRTSAPGKVGGTSGKMCLVADAMGLGES